jgi:hypothetical protein
MVYSHAATNFLIPQKAPCTTSRLLLLCPSSVLFPPAFLYVPISSSRYHCLLFHGATISCMAPSMIIRPVPADLSAKSYLMVDCLSAPASPQEIAAEWLIHIERHCGMNGLAGLHVNSQFKRSIELTLCRSSGRAS